MDRPVEMHVKRLAAGIVVVASVAVSTACGGHAAARSAAPAAKPAGSTQTDATQGAPALQADDVASGSASTSTSTARQDAAGAATAERPLAGEVVGIDPGHNGGNFSDPSFINRLVWNGRERETCDTTGTETDGGYTEAQFNYNLARYLAGDLRRLGATVVLTRTSNSGVGPCVNARARILDRARADAAIDIHADGGPSDGRGFAILEPVDDGVNARVIAASKRLGNDLRRRYLSMTRMPRSTYDGVDGIAYRSDLAGLNLTTVPKVLIETGNMRNAQDAALLVSPRFQRLAARAFVAAIADFLHRARR